MHYLECVDGALAKNNMDDQLLEERAQDLAACGYPGLSPIPGSAGLDGQ